MISVTADTTLLQARILQVSNGVKGGLRKAVGDSAARIGVQLARDTFPLSEKGAMARKEAQVRRAYPSPGRVYEILKSWPDGVTGYLGKEDFQKFKLRLAKLFLHFCKEGQMGEAVRILNAFPPFRATVASSANEATFRSFTKQRTGAGDLNKQGLPKVFWNCILLPPGGDSSRNSLITKARNKAGSIANGWVVASRHFRKGRSTDYLPKLKTRKQKIVTGSGRWEGSDSKPVAVLANTYHSAFRVMRSGAFDRAVSTEIRNLDKQLVNQAKFAARKARLGT